MPSLWKKHKGNRISRLVADLQTTPKRGGSLVVETGFPTSLVDLFVKNRDKLKKPKTKKHKSKKVSIITEDDVYDQNNNNGVHQSNSMSPLVSDPSSASFSELQVPKFSILENCEEDVSQIDKNDIFVEEIDAHHNPIVKLHHDSCKKESNVEENENLKVSNSKNMVLLSSLVGVMVFCVVLYARKWCLAMITLGFLLLVMLECVGNSGFGFFKPCENAVSMAVLKGALVVVVALYTKWFVVGITIGASLLLLLEYAWNSAFGFFKPCPDVKGEFQGIWPQCGVFRQRREFDENYGRKGGRGVLKRAVLIGSKREVRSKGGYDIVLKRDFDQGVGNGAISRRGREPEEIATSEEDEDGITSKGESEPGSADSTPVNDTSQLLKEETQNKPMYELLPYESKDVRSLDGYINLQGEKGTIEGGKNEFEDVIANYHGKDKKSKKFWKKLVPKKKNKKKKQEHGREHCAAHIDGIEDTATEFEEEDEQAEGEQKISTTDGSLTSITDEDDESGAENFSAANRCFTEMLQLDNRTSKSRGTGKERYGNLKYLTTMMIPLTGLIGGRILAVGLTVICYLVFKMLRG